MSKAMTVKQLIEELEKHPNDAEALIVLAADEELSWHAIAKVEDGGWEKEDGSSPIIGLFVGELIID